MDEFRRQTELVRAMFKKDKIPRTPKFDTFIDAVLELIDDAPHPTAMTTGNFLNLFTSRKMKSQSPFLKKPSCYVVLIF